MTTSSRFAPSARATARHSPRYTRDSLNTTLRRNIPERRMVSTISPDTAFVSNLCQAAVTKSPVTLTFQPAAGGDGQWCGSGVVLATLGRGVSVRVVPELTEHPGAEDDTKS